MQDDLDLSADVSLEKIDAVRVAIEAAATVQEIKHNLNWLAAAETYARQAEVSKELQFKILEYNFRAKCKLGEMLEAAKAAGQITKGGDRGNQYTGGKVPNENHGTFTLKQAGISKKLSMHAQQLAAIPKEEREQIISEAKKIGKFSRNMFSKKHAPKPPKSHPAKSLIVGLSDKGLTQSEIATKTGVSQRTVRREIEYEGIRREAATEPVVTRADLSATAQEKFDRAIQREKERLAAQFRIDVDREVKNVLNDSIGPAYRQRDKDAQAIFNTYRRGIMTRKQYNQIRACLHTDRMPTAQEKHDAFILLTSFEKYLLSETESPMPKAPPLPSNTEEWDALRKKVSEERRQKAKNARHTSTSIRTK